MASPAGRSASAAQTSTGSRLPFKSTDWCSRKRTRPRASSTVRRPQSTSPGPAAFSRRAATFTVSPMTVMSSERPTAVAITSPEFTPIEKARSPPRPLMASAAATARSASSSCETGTPKTAITESPMNLSTVPPWAATISPSCRKAVSTSWATTSGSVRSASEVKPTTSAKSTVASLRSSSRPTPASPPSPSAVPHCPQNRCPSALAAPHVAQAATASALPHWPQYALPSGFALSQLRQTATASAYRRAAAAELVGGWVLTAGLARPGAVCDARPRCTRHRCRAIGGHDDR